MNIEDKLIELQYKIASLKEDIEKLDDSFNKLCYDTRILNRRLSSLKSNLKFEAKRRNE